MIDYSPGLAALAYRFLFGLIADLRSTLPQYSREDPRKPGHIDIALTFWHDQESMVSEDSIFSICGEEISSDGWIPLCPAQERHCL